MLDQVNTTAFSRSQHIDKGREGVVIYVRSMDFEQIVFRGTCRNQSLLSGLGPADRSGRGHIIEQCVLLGTLNPKLTQTSVPAHLNFLYNETAPTGHEYLILVLLEWNLITRFDSPQAVPPALLFVSRLRL